MKFGRILANAFARRIAYVVIALLLAWVGLGDAKADQNYPDQGSAQAGCQSSLAVAGAHAGATPKGCTLTTAPTTSYYTCRVTGPNGAEYTCGFWHGGTHTTHYFPTANGCSVRASTTFAHDVVIPTGSVGCNNGCAFQTVNNGDGTYTGRFDLLGGETCSVLPSCTQSGWYINHATGMCQPPEEECPANQTKNPKTKQCEEACPTGMVMDPTGACKPSADDCPAGNVRAPSGECLPGEGQCAAGEARRANGTCGKDSDGDGQADEDDEDPENDPDKETASGGDSCNAPPSCSGGPIMCLQAKIQWRIDCNTRSKVNVTGGACGAMPVCVGENCKAMEYSQLLMQWRTACALEKMEFPEPGEGSEGEKIKPDFEGLAAGGDGANAEDSIFLPEGDGEGLNQGLISYGAGALGWNFSVDGQQFGMPQQISDFIALLKWLIIAAASLVGIAIAAGKL